MSDLVGNSNCWFSLAMAHLQITRLFCSYCSEERNYILVRNVFTTYKKVHVGNDQEKAQTDRNPHSKDRGGKN